MKSSGVEIKLFVGNLDPETTQEELEAIFAQYGSVKELHLLKDHSGASKRSAFVKYFAKASADAAVLALHEKVTDKNSPSRMVVSLQVHLLILWFRLYARRDRIIKDKEALE